MAGEHPCAARCEEEAPAGTPEAPAHSGQTAPRSSHRGKWAQRRLEGAKRSAREGMQKLRSSGAGKRALCGSSGGTIDLAIHLAERPIWPAQVSSERFSLQRPYLRGGALPAARWPLASSGFALCPHRESLTRMTDALVRNPSKPHPPACETIPASPVSWTQRVQICFIGLGAVGRSIDVRSGVLVRCIAEMTRCFSCGDCPARQNEKRQWDRTRRERTGSSER
ncbi:hypothetical protein IscW_ISCW022238 [Ixodes scapularis]|uniref:Uncharacterized protein n=1 Tax=Ixodes scapularis TaxID=6945 RepID=B7QEP3_IXOSC|nr:hypothetical protein IscW_ISCW022238 [Ixodes scapularis]|eukprot:XP_002414007.1 hypothetical protein IscW_ISCW022238 [Ixodes scapularis]